ncbi:PREDICTED: uncharacterized protein LOC106814285 [Priapulus caudatus]|uniref:Uncharacterized protein LOC106814285 n=1 Tax=Priapulus caudatus TaxID=37621 RepID=A0ABM1EPE6_PRICU|nr:PREDICTED: uncharacterized protein LOC106814285 [Priapulus caudatus]
MAALASHNHIVTVGASNPSVGRAAHLGRDTALCWLSCMPPGGSKTADAAACCRFSWDVCTHESAVSLHSAQTREQSCVEGASGMKTDEVSPRYRPLVSVVCTCHEKRSSRRRQEIDESERQSTLGDADVGCYGYARITSPSMLESAGSLLSWEILMKHVYIGFFT